MIISQFDHKNGKDQGVYPLFIGFAHFRSFMLKILEGAITSWISDC